MAFEIIKIPAHGAGAARDELNRLRRGRKVVSRRKGFVAQGEASFWAFWLEFVESGGGERRPGERGEALKAFCRLIRLWQLGQRILFGILVAAAVFGFAPMSPVRAATPPVESAAFPLDTRLVLVTASAAISGGANTFGDSAQVAITSNIARSMIYYTLDGTAPFIGGPLTYGAPFTVTSTKTIRALAVNLDDFSTKESDPLTVSILPTYALTLSTPGGGAVAKSPSAPSYLNGSSVSLTATPDAGWTFLHWAGDATDTQSTTTVTMDRARSVQAVFGTTVTANVIGSGSVQLSPASGPYPYGSVVRLTPKPGIGSAFSLWGGVFSGRANPLDLTITEATPTVAVLFSVLSGNQVNLYTTIVGGGTLSVSPLKNFYTSGEMVTVTAIASPGRVFASWSGDASGTQNPLSVTMTASKTITANFVNAVQGVTINVPIGGTEYAAPATVTIEAGVVDIVATKVEFFEGLTKIGEDTSSPFSFAWSNVPAGSYSLTAKATDSAALSLTSIPVNILISEPPHITVQPQSKNAVLGENVEFSVAATGKVPLHYQWRTNGIAIPGATSSAYRLAGVSQLGTTPYTVVVTNSVGSDTSDVALLTVSALPGQTIAFAELVDRTMTNSPFTLSATASSGLPVSFALVSGPARLTNDVLYLTGAGLVTVRVSQSGNGSIAPATSVDRSFNVSLPPAPTVTTDQGVAKLIVPYASNVRGLQYAIERQPSSGAVSLVGDRLTYTPVPSFFGLVDFVYRITDPVTGVQTPGVVVNLVVLRVEPIFSLEQAAYSIGEGAGFVTINIRKNISAAGRVFLSTGNVTATKDVGSGGDYSLQQSFLDFGSGETSRSVAISLSNDSIFEGNEAFEFEISVLSPSSVVAPSRATITIVEDDSGLIDTHFRLPDGLPDHEARLQVGLNPPGVQGRWRFLGQRQWSASGAISEGLPEGDYDVEFKPANGFAHPLPVRISLTNGITRSYLGYYTTTLSPRLGNLTVTCAGTAQGGWKFEEEVGSAYRVSGATVSGLNAGTYTIQFKPVDGLIAPGNMNVEVKFQSTQTYSATYLVPPVTTDRVKPAVAIREFLKYPYIGEISRWDGELGSGFVVKERVVMTAAHVLFDSRTLGNAKRVRWHFQRHRGTYEPKPLTPRGWNLYAGYAAQRTNEGVGSPSTPFSQNLDVAAMFFTEAAGLGGYGGYLASISNPNEWLTSTEEKIISGYPIDGIASADQGKIHETPPAPVSLIRVLGLTEGNLYSSSQLLTYPGNSGGPLCVRHSSGKFYPAGIFVALDAERVYVRSLDFKAVEMIAAAELSGRTGTNASGGGVTILSTTFVETNDETGLLQVFLSPLAAVDAGAGWRLAGGDPSYVSLANSTNRLLAFGYELEFKPVTGFVAPSNFSLTVASGVTHSVLARYKRTQTLEFPVIPTQHQGGGPLHLSATASSGLTVQYELVSGPATLTGNTLTLTAVGSVIVRARQDGNDDFAPASPVDRSFLVLNVGDPGTGPSLRLPELEVGAGQEFVVPLVATDFRAVTRVQFSLRWDPALIEFVAAGAGQLPGVGDGNFNTLSVAKGQLTFSWDDPDGGGRDLGEKDALLVLRFRTKNVGSAIAVLEFSDQPTVREIAVRFNAVPWQAQSARVFVGIKRADVRVAIERRGTDGVALLFPALAGAEFVVETSDQAEGLSWRSIGTVSGSVGDRVLPLVVDREKSGFYRFRLMTLLPEFGAGN